MASRPAIMTPVPISIAPAGISSLSLIAACPLRLSKATSMMVKPLAIAAVPTKATPDPSDIRSMPASSGDDVVPRPQPSSNCVLSRLPKTPVTKLLGASSNHICIFAPDASPSAVVTTTRFPKEALVSLVSRMAPLEASWVGVPLIRLISIAPSFALGSVSARKPSTVNFTPPSCSNVRPTRALKSPSRPSTVIVPASNPMVAPAPMLTEPSAKPRSMLVVPSGVSEISLTTTPKPLPSPTKTSNTPVSASIPKARSNARFAVASTVASAPAAKLSGPRSKPSASARSASVTSTRSVRVMLRLVAAIATFILVGPPCPASVIGSKITLRL